MVGISVTLTAVNPAILILQFHNYVIGNNSIRLASNFEIGVKNLDGNRICFTG
jgi:hypothetical protein